MDLSSAGRRTADVRAHLSAAEDAATPLESLPHLRAAADCLTDLIDDTLAAAVLSDDASIRSAGRRVGLSENAVGPRLARTHTLGAYANDSGRVTAAGIERARYDAQRSGPSSGPPSSPEVDPASTRAPMRFKPRRPS